MLIDDPLEYRGEGYITIALWEDDDVENPTYVWIDPEWDENYKVNPELAKSNLRRFLTQRQMKPVLLKMYREKFKDTFRSYDFDTMISFIFSYGGVNINPETGAWKAFIPLDQL